MLAGPGVPCIAMGCLAHCFLFGSVDIHQEDSKGASMEDVEDDDDDALKALWRVQK